MSGSARFAPDKRRRLGGKNWGNAGDSLDRPSPPLYYSGVDRDGTPTRGPFGCDSGCPPPPTPTARQPHGIPHPACPASPHPAVGSGEPVLPLPAGPSSGGFRAAATISSGSPVPFVDDGSSVPSHPAFPPRAGRPNPPPTGRHRSPRTSHRPRAAAHGRPPRPTSDRGPGSAIPAIFTPWSVRGLFVSTPSTQALGEHAP